VIAKDFPGYNQQNPSRSWPSAPFGARLRAAMDARGPLCVGIDPHPDLLAAWGLPDAADGLERFSSTVVEALASEVAVLKPQSACYERHGSRGIAVLERVMAAARAAGALVLLDVKRGDIGSTMQAYADAYLRPGAPLFADAVTASPYLGFDSLRPLVGAALEAGAGVFVLALTSNPEARQLQQAVCPDGRTVAGSILAGVAACNAGIAPLGSIGAVVAATIGSTAEDLVVNGPLLAPGLGAQGATAADLRRVFGTATRNVLPSISRTILRAGPDSARLRASAAREADALAAVLG
jgi:orotidine-5'-phosphate decarboxylase